MRPNTVSRKNCLSKRWYTKPACSVTNSALPPHIWYPSTLVRELTATPRRVPRKNFRKGCAPRPTPSRCASGSACALRAPLLALPLLAPLVQHWHCQCQSWCNGTGSVRHCQSLVRALLVYKHMFEVRTRVPWRLPRRTRVHSSDEAEAGQLRAPLALPAQEWP